MSFLQAIRVVWETIRVQKLKSFFTVIGVTLGVWFDKASREERQRHTDANHGGLEGAGLYITRTELHELLAQLFDANRQPDSAAVHYAVVDRAWASADPPLRARRDAARQWLARTGRR